MKTLGLILLPWVAVFVLGMMGAPLWLALVVLFVGMFYSGLKFQQQSKGAGT